VLVVQKAQAKLQYVVSSTAPRDKGSAEFRWHTHTHTPGLEGDARERVCPVYSSFPPSFCLEQAVLLSDAVSVSVSLSERVLRENSTPSSLDFVFPLLRK
jgi:hypothetical protein